MPDLRVPEPYRAGLQELVDADDDFVTRLLTAFHHIQPTLRRSELVSRVMSHLQGEEPYPVADIIDSLLALYSVRAFLEYPVSDFADGIASSRDLDISEEERQCLGNRLRVFLDMEPLKIASKALEVVTEQQHSLHDARILTDVRPIFSEDVAAAPAGAVIVHTLRIRYHKGKSRNLEEFFVAMSPSNAAALRATIDRAEDKARSLQSMLEAARVPYLDAGEQ